MITAWGWRRAIDSKEREPSMCAHIKHANGNKEYQKAIKANSVPAMSKKQPRCQIQIKSNASKIKLAKVPNPYADACLYLGDNNQRDE